MNRDEIVVEKDSTLGWVVINRPEKLNSFTGAMWQRLNEAVKTLEGDSSIRVILIRGAGERAFSAGADITEFRPSGAAPDASTGNGSPFDMAMVAIAQCSKPTVAMIHGVCMGGGCALALSTDIRLASTDAVFAITPAKIGLGYPFGSVERTVRELGPANARYMLITGAKFSANKAKEMGLVQEVVAPEELENAATEMGRLIAGNAPKTIRAVKECVRHSVLDEAQRNVEACNALINECAGSEDFREGILSFVEKRPPNFQDR